MKIKDMPKHERPREKMVNLGVSNLKDKELLAIIFRTGTKEQNVIELVEEILKKHPLKKLLQLKLGELVNIKGIDVGKACSLLASFEITKRALEVNENNLPHITTARDAVNQLMDIRAKNKENFVVLYLNARNQLIEKETISIGTVNASLVHPREVFEPALRNIASQVILAHNHPSGSTEPSEGDIEVTKRMKEAGKILGIEILDHVIITKDGFGSMKELGCF